MGSNDDFETGYGKPPKSGQFQKGKSGNPRGRPKGSGNVGPQLKKAMQQKYEIDTEKGRRMMSATELLATKLVHSAINGSVRDKIQLLKAIDQYAPELLEQIDVPTGIEVVFTHSDGEGGVFKRTPQEMEEAKQFTLANRRRAKEEPDPLDM